MPHTDNTFYSARCGALALLQKQNAAMRARTMSTTGDHVPPFMRNYSYTLSPWPMIVSPQRVGQFDELVSRLPPLLLKAIRCVFGGDGAKFTDYLNESPLIHDLLTDPGFDLAQAVNRHDVVFSGGAMKLLEVNAGFALGGWQPGLLETTFKQVLDDFPETAGWDLRHRQIADKLFASVLSAIARLKPGSTHANVAMYCGDSEASAALETRFHHALAGAAQTQGRLFHFKDFDDIGFANDGAVLVDGERMDAVLLTEAVHQHAPKQVYLQLVGAHMMGHIVMPDSLMYMVFGNKLLLALLHDPALARHLTPDEADFIARHIPLSVRMRSADLLWKDELWPLADLLRENKDDFVIKKAHSMQGQDVHIGRFVEQGEWEALINRVKGDADWLAQAFCPVDTVSAPDGAGGMADYALVWGLFEIGRRYGGAFVRGMPAGRGRGVINSAQGASEFSVFEEPPARE